MSYNLNVINIFVNSIPVHKEVQFSIYLQLGYNPYFYFGNTFLCFIFMFIPNQPINKNNVKGMFFFFNIDF